MPYDPRRHNHRSIRLKGYDYTQPGAYFVTICVQDRRPCLSAIARGEVRLSPIGAIVQRHWQALPRHFPFITAEPFVVMPDHLHGIVTIHERASAEQPSPQSEPHGTTPGSLAAIIQNFKSVSTRMVNRLEDTPGARLWMEDYYERIVRDQAALEQITRYIAKNPSLWRE